MFTTHLYLVYIHKEDLALNNRHGLICHKSKRKYNHIYLPIPPLGQDMTQGQFLSGV